MYTYILMILDMFENSNMHYFILFFSFIFIRWGVVWGHAIKYKPYKYEGDTSKLFTSVIIPVVDEPLDLFEKVLHNISIQRPSEIIVVINGAKNEGLENLCADFNKSLDNNMTPVKYFYTPVAGKRNAIRIGVENVDEKSEISVLVDSDTIWTEGTLSELMKPFLVDQKIGGVTTRQKILNPERTLVTMFANLLEEIRAEGTMKAMSVKEKVGCLPGRTIAFRTPILQDSMYEFMNETFMGIHKEVSDDRSLTNLTLKKGYKTVMQDTSVVYTDAPEGWKKFIRQQFRWANGSQYNNLRMTPWMMKNAKLMCFVYWTDMIMPMLIVSVSLNTLICTALNTWGVNIPMVEYPVTGWQGFLLVILGSILCFGARNIVIMKNQKWYYVLLIPVFIFVLTAIMVPVRIFGLMTCSDNRSWGTRQLVEDETVI